MNIKKLINRDITKKVPVNIIKDKIIDNIKIIIKATKSVIFYPI